MWNLKQTSCLYTDYVKCVLPLYFDIIQTWMTVPYKINQFLRIVNNAIRRIARNPITTSNSYDTISFRDHILEE